MSGGVDSSVCAYLLKKQGYEVIGVFMQNWDSYLNNDIKGHLKADTKQCNAQKDFQTAKLVANKLGIKIYRTEFINKYWNKVFCYLINEYKGGRTPNPDILCNKYIKFDEFIKHAQEHFQCKNIAMGHYANVLHKKNHFYLTKAKDKDKDQTYFLCWLTEEQLQHTTFPLGNLLKSKVRAIAKNIGLENWSKKDSTGICFIGERNFKDFLSNYLSYKRGKIIDVTTKAIIGYHDGVAFFTYGQNKGMNLSGCAQRYFVCGKDLKKNILYVCTENSKNKYLATTKCSLTKFNWINGIPKSKNVFIRFRHRQKLIKGTFDYFGKDINLNYPQTLAITPGQFAVLYQGKICLGGGIVDKISK
jgi:tRNA-specific 2-thiouridylase